MTVPLLTPADTAIFDDDVITELEQRLGDSIPCDSCGGPAAVRASSTCCGDALVWCQGCYLHHRIIWDVWIATARTFGCAGCGHTFGRITHIDEVVKVVSL